MSKPYDFDAINKKALPQLPKLVAQWLPDGKRAGDNWVAKNPRREDRNVGSFKINLNNGAWADFAIGVKGHGAVSFLSYVANVPPKEAAKHLVKMFGEKEVSIAAAISLPSQDEKQDEWMPVIPVPKKAPSPMKTFSKFGEATKTWKYLDAKGNLLGLICRFDVKGKKEIMPQTYCKNSSGKLEWRWKAMPAPRPLYGLRELSERKTAPVLVVEGEKAADSAKKLFPKYVVVTSPGGTGGTGHADWDVLAGRKVKIWPDNDEAGQHYAADVAQKAHKAGAQSVAVVKVHPDFPAKWDLADQLPKGWTKKRLRKHFKSQHEKIEAVTQMVPSANPDSLRFADATQSEILIGLANEAVFFHTPNQLACVDVMMGEKHRVTWPVDSENTRLWLTKLYYNKTGDAPSAEALTKAINTLAARALFDGPEMQVYVRIGSHEEKTYVDRCDKSGSAIEIGMEGWKNIAEPPIRFLRKPGMLELPEPTSKGSLASLRKFINVKSEHDFILVVMWLLMAMRPKGPYPILVLIGEQGTAKSTLTALLRKLIDPSFALHRSMSSDERDLFISATNGWVLAFDNLSHLSSELSDALCRVATGGSYATRTLYTDDEEKMFHVSRPIILNGISNVVMRGDLADRALVVSLEPIPESKRKTEEEIWKDFNALAPSILGALLDISVHGLKKLPHVKLNGKPRMADFAKWGTACETAIGVRGTFMAAYEANSKEANENVIAASHLATAICALMEHEPIVQKTPTELFDELSEKVDHKILHDKRLWPSNSRIFSSWLTRIAPALRKAGIEVTSDLRGKNGIRLIKLVRTGNAPISTPPAPQRQKQRKYA